MNLFRVIAILVIVWLVIYMVKRALGQRKEDREERTPRHESEKVVRCARCAVHVPESKALREGDRFYCSREHRDADKD